MKKEITAKKSKSGKTLELRVPTTINKVNTQKRKKNRRNRRASRTSQSGRLALVSNFKRALIYPDLMGPCRFPRYGSSDRTGLAMDKARVIIVGSALAPIQGLQLLGGNYGTALAQPLSAATISNAFTFGAQTTPGTAFPSTSNVADINQTAGVLIVSYTGNPLECTGEILLGSCIPINGTATYNSLYFYPGTVKIPVAELINRPMRVYMRKLSSSAEEFIPLATSQADVDLPFVLTQGLTPGGTVNIEITRCFEFRSTTSDGNVVPYDKASESYSIDAAAYQDASGEIGQLPMAVRAALPPTEDGSYIPGFNQLLEYGVVPGLLGAAGMVFNRLNQYRHRGNAHPFGQMAERDLEQ